MGTFTTAMLSVARTRRAMLGIVAGFFIQGFIAVSWLPRIPEIIDNLGVSFGTWGLIIGIAGVGALVPLLFVNRLINRFGSRPLIQLAFLIAAISNASFGFIHNPWIFFVAAFVQNFGWGVYNLTINSHSVVFQNRIGRVVLGRFHASWSIGAASSSFLTGVFAAFVSLHNYLLVIDIVGVAVAMLGTSQMLGPREDGHEEEKKRADAVPLLKTPGYVFVLAFGLFCAVLPEAAMMDWGAVFAKQNLHLSPALQGLPYSLFVTAMIIGRLSIGRLSRRRHLSRIGQIGGALGAIAITVAVTVGTMVGLVSPLLALGLTVVFWIATGLASGPQVPAMFSVSGSVKGISTAQAMSRMSLVNSGMLLFTKILLGGIAQGVGVPYLFAIPVACYLGSFVISGYVLRRAEARMDIEHPSTGDDAPNIDENEAFEAFPATGSSQTYP